MIDFLKNAVTLSIFELEKCSLHQNGVEFQKKMIGTIISRLVRQLLAQSGIRNLKRTQGAEVSHQSPVGGGGDLTHFGIR